MQKLAIIPHSLTCIRIAALPLFFLLYSSADPLFVICLFISVSSTDLIDGYLARRFNVHSDAGAFFDSIADFTLLLGMFLLFTDAGLYPLWITGIIIFAFTQFVFSSLLSKKLYDPIGKYYGSVLYGAVALTIIFPIPLICNIVVISFAMFAAASIVSRIAHFLGFLQTKDR